MVTCQNNPEQKSPQRAVFSCFRVPWARPPGKALTSKSGQLLLSVLNSLLNRGYLHIVYITANAIAGMLVVNAFQAVPRV